MTNSNLEDIFFQDLGAFVACGGHLDTVKSCLRSKQAKIQSSKTLAKYAFSLLKKRSSNKEFNKDAYLLNKVANTTEDSWTSFHDEVVDTFIKVANPLSTLGTAGSLAFRGITPLVGAVPTLAATAIPISGMVMGGGAHVAETAINEDSLDTETLKALIVKYKQLTAQLERDIANKRRKLEAQELLS